MPRHPSLVPLSHDHHHTLVLALRLKKGGPASQHDSWPDEEKAHAMETLRFAEVEILPHFRIEEEILFGNSTDGGIRDLEEELRTEHTAIRALLKQLAEHVNASAEEGTASLLVELGQKLETHIRREEREYFPKLEAIVEPAMLVQLGATIKDAHNPESPFRVCKI